MRVRYLFRYCALFTLVGGSLFGQTTPTAPSKKAPAAARSTPRRVSGAFRLPGNRQTSEVETLVQDAQQKIRASDWDGAEQVLRKAESQCRQSSTEMHACTLVDFAQAFYWQQKATTLIGTERIDALTKGKQAYNRVVETAPTNAAALNNLALIETSLFFGTTDAARRSELLASASSHWKAAMNANTGQFARYAVALGDFLARAGQRNEALGMYREAASRTDEDLPRRRIVENAGLISPMELFNTCGEWREHYSDLAASCYENVLRRVAVSDSSLAQQAFTGWAYVLARTDQMSSERLASLPANWSDASVRELRQFWSNPNEGFNPGGFWLRDPHRAAVAAELVTAACKGFGGTSAEAEKGEACFEKFLGTQPSLLEHLSFLPPADTLNEEVASVLNLYRHLLSLYARFPNQQSEQKSESLIAHIFEGKGQFILRRNWSTTQDFHAALAAIYIERGVWTGVGATNALYQLQAVVTDGDRLADESEGALVNSLPEVRQLLAKAYLVAARTAKLAQQVDLRRMAATAYVNAAMDYLDYDAVDSAQSMLSLYATVKSPVAFESQVEEIVKLRLSASGLSMNAIDEAHQPLLYRGSLAVPGAFLARQRFKLLSDIAVSNQQSETTRLSAASGAYQTMQTEKVTLLGASDVVRWQRTEAQLLSATNAAAPASIVAYGKAAAIPSGAVPVTLPGEKRPGYITLSPQTTKTAELVKKVGPSEMVRIKKYLYFQNGQILVQQDSPATTDPAINKVEQVLKIRPIA